jgi:PAS domain S-box-containing protein
MYDSYPIFKHLNRVSILLILSITFLLPAGYFSSYYHRLQGQLAAETNYVASIVSDFIAHNPTIWSFEEHRFPALLNSLTMKHQDAKQSIIIRIYTNDNDLVSQVGECDELEILRVGVEYAIYDFGNQVGKIELVSSIRPLLYETLLVFILTLLSGLLLYFPIRMVSNRTIQNMMNELKQEREKLIDSEQTSRAITETAADAIIVIDGDALIIYWNPAAERIFGYGSDEVLGKNLHHLITAEENYAAQEKGVANFKLTGKGHVLREQLEMNAIRKNGQKFLVALSVSSVKLNNQWHAVGIIRDMTLRQEHEQVLKSALAEAEEASQVKSEFLSNMSHEIRTPMNAIIGMSYLASQTNLNKKQQNYIDKVHRSAKGLLGILNDILDFSKIESGKLVIEEVAFRLEDIMEDMENLITVIAEEKGIELGLHISPEVPTALVGDSLRLSQVLSNLGSNAVKFTEEGGKIQIDVKTIKNNDDNILLHFSISDTGIGIEQQQQEKMFEPFSQADSSITRRFGGTGLGLAITYKLVQMMGGKIWFESKINEGTTFYFTASLQHQQGEPSALLSQSQKLGEEELKSTILKLRGAKLLLVEDNDINQELVEEILTSNDIQVDIASNGLVALDFLEKNDYDGVLMDCQMPVMDGYTACQKIREQSEWIDLPIIAMTANVMTGDRDKVINAGMNDYIAKPIGIVNMFNTMAKWISPNHSASLKNQPEKKESTATEALTELPELPGIDIAAGLAVTMNNMTLYRRLLGRFYEKQQDFELQFKNAMNDQDSEATVRLAHTLKGVAGNMGMTKLQATAQLLETACKQSSDDIGKIQENLVGELAIVLQGLAIMVGQDVPVVTDQAEKEINIAVIEPLLNDLYQLVLDDNIDSIETSQKLSHLMENTIYAKDMRKIFNLVSDYDFGLALDAVKALTECIKNNSKNEET